MILKEKKNFFFREKFFFAFKIFGKNEKISKSKKKIFREKKNFFFGLKSFLNGFKAILRVIFFVGFFGGVKFALEKKQKNPKKITKNVKKRQN